MAQRRKRYNCDGCRRAFPGCSYVCESNTIKESEAPKMKQMHVSLVNNVKNIQEIKNVMYPATFRPGGIWQRIIRMLTDIFSGRKRKQRLDHDACITCVYWKDWKCLKHRIEKAATGPRCRDFKSVGSMPLADVVNLRKQLDY